ncbi:MAG: DUF58 domain-containing protein [Candidatus Zipacnadales bacterium]
MIPTPLFLFLFLLGAPLAAIGAPSTPLGLLSIAWCMLVIALLVADNRLSLRAHALGVERYMERKLSVGTENVVHLKIDNLSRWTIRVTVKDDPPSEFRTPRRALSAILLPWKEATLEYVTVPPKRGHFRFGDLHVRGRSFLGLSHWQRSIPAETFVNVYPDIHRIRRLDAILRAHQLEDIGLRRARMRGTGTEFESLREYVRDDDYRRIDWKATARYGSPFTRQYEEERSRTIMLLIDAGRMMSAEVEGLSKLDHAVNAALMLAYVALRRDDAVGLIAFADTVKALIPPRKGKGQLQRLLEALYEVQPTLTEPDYRTAMHHLHDRARKRSLAVLFTDLIDEQASQRLISQVAAAYPRHLPLLVTLSDPDVVRAAETRPQTSEELFERAVASAVLADRQRAIARLRGSGAVVLDTSAAELSIALVNQYLELKERLRV